MHAAIIVINEAIDKQNAEETMSTLQIPAATLVNLIPESTQEYQILLYDAKQSKAEIARNKVRMIQTRNCFKSERSASQNASVHFLF